MGKQTKTVTYPSKKTLNLAIREKSPFRPQKLIPLLLVVLAAVGLFAKFAVIDRINEYNCYQAEADAREAEVAAMNKALEIYPEVLEEYSRYSVSWMSEELRSSVARTQILALIDEEILPYSEVHSVAAVGNTVSVELGAITLEKASELVKNIEARDDVESVQIYSADTTDEEGLNALIAMLINVRLPEGGAK